MIQDYLPKVEHELRTLSELINCANRIHVSSGACPPKLKCVLSRSAVAASSSWKRARPTSSVSRVWHNCAYRDEASVCTHYIYGPSGSSTHQSVDR